MRTLEGKHIVLGISGGIAAYKSAALLRLMVKRGAEVQVVITPNGKEFITPATLAALSGKPVVSEFFAANTGEWHSHVDLGLWADLMVVAPATASTIGKMANGIADNMLITTYLSAKEHVMVAPAMDLDMWAHPSTQRNVATLMADGVEVIMPASGELASHLTGRGRMEEPEVIVKRVEDFFAAQGADEAGTPDLRGRRVLVTAGPTREKIDPVRYISNYSSGKMGYALVEALEKSGAEVVLVTGPVEQPAPKGNVEVIRVETAREMHSACMEHFAGCDAAVLCAAVADYRTAEELDRKLKREATGDFSLRLVKNPDIAADLGRIKGDRTLVGFALETDHELENALDKMKRKHLDWIALNSLREAGACFGVDTNRVTLLSNDGAAVELPLESKQEVARRIVDVCLANLAPVSAPGEGSHTI